MKAFVCVCTLDTFAVGTLVGISNVGVALYFLLPGCSQSTFLQLLLISPASVALIAVLEMYVAAKLLTALVILDFLFPLLVSSELMTVTD